MCVWVTEQDGGWPWCDRAEEDGGLGAIDQRRMVALGDRPEEDETGVVEQDVLTVLDFAQDLRLLGSDEVEDRVFMVGEGRGLMGDADLSAGGVDCFSMGGC